MVRFLVPREHSPGEKRVAATPETVRRLLGKGVSVKVQQGAGAAAGFRDDDFLAVGAELGPEEGLPWEEADGVLVDTQLGPGEDFKEFVEGAIAAGEGDEGLAFFDHEELALVHGGGDVDDDAMLMVMMMVMLIMLR